jgi:glutamate formiminotransferase/formiminotetrahydrofolate cyclodeaminase
MKIGRNCDWGTRFVIAYNVNLNTKAVRRAMSVAFDVKENGRIKTEDACRPENPFLIKAANPSAFRHVKTCESHRMVCRGIWHLQVSMNLTNLRKRRYTLRLMPVTNRQANEACV